MLYMVTWIPSIYPSHVSIYSSTMDPLWVCCWPRSKCSTIHMSQQAAPTVPSIPPKAWGVAVTSGRTVWRLRQNNWWKPWSTPRSLARRRWENLGELWKNLIYIYIYTCLFDTCNRSCWCPLNMDSNDGGLFFRNGDLASWGNQLPLAQRMGVCSLLKHRNLGMSQPWICQETAT